MQPFEERQRQLNPHRDEDRDRATDVAYSQLRQRGVSLTGDEPAGQLADLLAAVERFEAAVSALGGDRMTNSLDTPEHDDDRLVLPQHTADEALSAYIRRVDEATDRLGASAEQGAPAVDDDDLMDDAANTTRG